MSEKREFLRIPVTVKVMMEENGGFYFTENLSEGGFHMKSENPPVIGSIFKAQLSLPQVEELIEVKCEVMWRKEGQGCGVRFLNMTKANKQIIQEFLSA